MTKPFVHLHCHSHYSLLDGASPIPRLVERAKERGMNALALTDHGNLYGALEFYRTARAAGINPIIGYEAYIAKGSRFDKSGGSQKDSSYHLTLLARNRTGFKNLVKMASAASLEGFYFKPRIDRELLEQFNEGIVCLSGCLSSEFSRAILMDKDPDQTEAVETAQWFSRLFGDRYFIEIMNNCTGIQKRVSDTAIEIADQIGVPLVTTCDTHYADREDADMQDVMLCINTGKYRSDPNRMQMDGQEYYLKSPEEMYRLFPEQEAAVARTQEIADSIDIDLELGKRHFPVYKLPPGWTPKDKLLNLCIDGINERYGHNVPGEVTARLTRELEVINKLGFDNYFLVVWDFVRFARERGIPATARGSGVGSLVSYSLYLSHVDPLRYGLLFERFLDENRKEAPDIDIDFCRQRRGEVIEYVKEKYGHVAQIGTIGTMAAKGSIKDVGRALGLPYDQVAAVADMVPDNAESIDEAIERSEDLAAAVEVDRDVRGLIHMAKRVEGLARNVGTHAAAVVIADKPLTEYVPLAKGKDGTITQWTMGDVEAAGLLKMDFLGLRNLTILAKTVELIRETREEEVDPLAFPLDDEATFALLCRGETQGVFQMESEGMTRLLVDLQPESVEHICACIALYRPGPLDSGLIVRLVLRKNDREPVPTVNEVADQILANTYGVITYQEQAMQIANQVAGIPLSEAYTLIKGIGKKKPEIVSRYHEPFISGCEANGVDGKTMWATIDASARYLFNKSHSMAYAMIAYQTAYLKAHYPVEFMAAVLSADIPGRNFQTKDSLVEHLQDCRRMGLEVCRPDVNSSGPEFGVSEGKITFGLTAIKGCGDPAAKAIQAEAPFRDLFDFCERVDSKACGRAVTESLVRAGAFDTLGHPRSRLLATLDRAAVSGIAVQKDLQRGQGRLFDDDDDAPPCEYIDLPEFLDKDRLYMEKDVLGYYSTGHPLAEYTAAIETYCTHTTSQLGEAPARSNVMVGGMLSGIRVAYVKNAKPGSPSRYASFEIEDLEGSVRCVIWPENYALYGSLIQPDAVLFAKGKIGYHGGGINIVVSSLLELSDPSLEKTSGVAIQINSPDQVDRVREIVAMNPGDCELQVSLKMWDGRRIKLRSEEGVRADLQLKQEIEEILGPNSVRMMI